MRRSTAGIAITACALGLTVLLGSCMDASLSQSGSAPAEVGIQQIPESVEQVTVSISGPGMADIEKTVTRDTDGLVLDIPAGPDRVFEAEAGGYAARSVVGVPPDGIQVSLALAVDRALLLSGGWEGESEVYEVPVMEGAAPRRLTDNTARDTEPLYTPDGSRVVFKSDRGENDFDFHLYSMKADGTDVSQLSDTFVEDNASMRTWAISPDGTTVAFFADPEQTDWDIYTVPVSGGTPTLVKTDATPGGAPDPLRWSPDGSRILYIGDNDSTGDDEVRTIDPDGGNEEVLASASFIGFADWLPGSDRVVYEYGGIESPDTIESVTTNPSEPDPIELDTRTDLNVKALSNDREALAYIVDNDGVGELYTVPTDGSGSPTFVTSGVDTFFGSFAWGRDGERIAITKNSRATVGYAAADGSGAYQTIETQSDFTVGFTSGQWPSESGTIAFVERIPTGGEAGYGVLWTADISGSEPTVTEVLGRQEPEDSYSVDWVNWRPRSDGST